jgi:hypothetical protein
LYFCDKDTLSWLIDVGYLLHEFTKEKPTGEGWLLAPTKGLNIP